MLGAWALTEQALVHLGGLGMLSGAAVIQQVFWSLRANMILAINDG